MSSVLHIDGKEYVTATTAGKYFGYTKDYMLLLAKEGKIDGQKIAHKWYIHTPTAEIFFKGAERARAERKKIISLERKTELSRHTSRRSLVNHHRTAVLETLVIVIIGLSLGATGYLGTGAHVASAKVAGEGNFFKELAISLYEFISPSEKVAVHNTFESDTRDTDTQEITSESEAHSFVVAPADSFTAEVARSVQESFSDEVTVIVDKDNPDTGIIVPQFKNTEGEAYRFLMVPVKTSTQ